MGHYKIVSTDKPYITKGIINGNKGQYGVAGIGDASLAGVFGKNALSNFNEFIDKELSKPAKSHESHVVNYEVQYSPSEDIKRKAFTDAVLGYASEDMNGNRIKIDDFDKKVKKNYGNQADARVLDTNNDGYIDLKENAAYIVLQDMMDETSLDDPQIDSKKIDGKFTNEGADMAAFMIFKRTNKNFSKNILLNINEKLFGKPE